MTERQTVAVHDGHGQLRWFPVADADRWTAITMEGGELSDFELEMVSLQ